MLVLLCNEHSEHRTERKTGANVRLNIAFPRILFHQAIEKKNSNHHLSASILCVMIGLFVLPHNVKFAPRDLYDLALTRFLY